MAKNREFLLLKRQYRIRNKLKAVSKGRLRLSVFRSSKNIYAQIIDDMCGKTLVSASTLETGSEFKNKCTILSASSVGVSIGKKAKAIGITSVYFDRGSHPYHGRIKAVAEAARQSGIEF